MDKNKFFFAACLVAYLSLHGPAASASVRFSGPVLKRIWEDRALPTSGAQVENIVAFLGENRRLLGLPDNPAFLLSLVQTQETAIGQRFVFEEKAFGLPVFESQLVAIASNNTLKSLFSELAEIGFGEKTAALSAAIAISLAANAVAAPELRFPATAELGYTKTGQLIYRVRLAATIPPADWEVWISAETGQVLHQEDRRLFVDGTGQVFDPDPKTAIESDTLHDWNDANWAIPPEAYSTATLYELNPPSGGYYYLSGPYVRTYQPTGAAREATPVFNYLRADDRFEEVVVYYHIDHTQRYFQDELQTPNANNRQQACNVNGSEEDNSWYSPFDRGITYGYGGVDDAEDADVIIHEYGHAVQDDINRFWSGGQVGAMGEGFGDYLAGSYSLSVDTTFHPNWIFTWDGHNEFWAGRVLNAPYHYPENAWGEVHDSGMLWSAGLMDVWWEIPDRVAWDRIVLQHHFLLGNGALMPDAAEAILTVEENLYNGLFRQVIVDNFAARGFVDPAFYYPQISHEPLPDSEDTLQTQFEVVAQITSTVPLDPASLQLFWRADELVYQSEILTPTSSPNEYHAYIPGPFSGQFISYYFTAADTTGMASFLPAQAPSAAFQFYVGADTIAPVITWVDSLGQTVMINADRTVRALAHDNIGISEAFLEWHVNAGELHIAPMLPVAADTFEGVLSYSDLSQGDIIYYRMRVIDSSSNQNEQESEEQTLSILATAQLDDFEGPIGPWLFTGTWGLTYQFSHGGLYSIEDSPGTQYQPNSDSWAQWGEGLDLSDFSRASLSFWELHLLEAGADVGRLQVSADGGPWETLVEVTGATPTWSLHEVELDSFCSGATEDLRFRFRVTTDGANNLFGWFIDDLSLTVEVIVPVAEADGFGALPAQYSLGPIYPNPFNPRAIIHFDLPRSGEARIEIFDISGRLVRVLNRGMMAAGRHHVAFEAGDLGSGLYFCRMRSGTYERVAKLLLLR